MTKDIRKSIYNIINPDNSGNIWSRAYNWIMLLAIVVGLFPMMFRKQCALFTWFDIASCFCFLVDYILRWFTADYIRGKPQFRNPTNSFRSLRSKPPRMRFLLFKLAFCHILTDMSA